MKKFIATLLVLASTLSFAGSTSVAWVRGDSEAQVDSELRTKVQEINRARRYRDCENPKVYAVSAPKKSYRVNRFGELEVQWTATIKMSCSND